MNIGGLSYKPRYPRVRVVPYHLLANDPSNVAAVEVEQLEVFDNVLMLAQLPEDPRDFCSADLLLADLARGLIIQKEPRTKFAQIATGGFVSMSNNDNENWFVIGKLCYLYS